MENSNKLLLINIEKKYLFLSLIILFLILTNPNNNDFNSFLKAKGFSKDVQGGRVNYFFIFSIYELRFKYGSNSMNERRFKCIGIAKNFVTLVDKK
jgi:hypothetical protein